MTDTKQVIVIRKDLNMRKGKMIAQACHASLGVITKMFNYQMTANGNVHIQFYQRRESSLIQWLENSFTKIVVSCDSEKELLDLHKQAESLKLLNCLIQDNGTTEFHRIPTYTALAIGPGYSIDIDVITGHLKLL